MYSTGRQNGVAKQLSEEWPWLLSVHCAAHRLALACKDASEDVPYMATFRDHLEQLHLYFRNSANRSASLKAAAVVLGVYDLKVKVNTLYLKYIDICEYFIIYLKPAVFFLLLTSK